MSTAATAITPITLDASYERCRALNKRHGTTYYWSTLALPQFKRRHVHALYAFCRHVDDIVDDLGPTSIEQRADALAAFGERFFGDLGRGTSDDAVLKAVVHTVDVFGIDIDCFRRFLRSMTMDLTVATYDTWDDLLVYMDGSAAVIGEMMLPILGPVRPEAVTHARDLGNAFQLTNFLRDIGEDLDRGRQYVPQEDLRGFHVHLPDRRVDAAFVELMRFQIQRCRRLYASADLGLAMLPERSARCIGAARRLYGRILERIEEQQYDVFTSRARVSTPEKAATVAKLVVPPSVRSWTMARRPTPIG